MSQITNELLIQFDKEKKICKKECKWLCTENAEERIKTCEIYKDEYIKFLENIVRQNKKGEIK